MFAVVMPAAGTATRFGAGDKLRVDLRGRTVLQRAAALFAQRPDVAQIIVVTAPNRFDIYRQHLASIIDIPRLTLAPGGQHRWQSVLCGLRAVHPHIDYVAIHDAARPLTPQSVIDAAFAMAIAAGASLPVVAEPATLKRVDAGGAVTQTVDRRGLFQAQTPQCFRRQLILQAFETLTAQNLLADVTDDAQLLERAGLTVQTTPGSAINIKITTAEDVALALALLDGQGSASR